MAVVIEKIERDACRKDYREGNGMSLVEVTEKVTPFPLSKFYLHHVMPESMQ